MKESRLQRAVLDWLIYHRVLHWREALGPIVVRGQGGSLVWRKNPKAGFPDIAGVLRRRHRGRFFVLEIKTDKGRVAPEQVEWMVDLQAAGAACAVIRSIDDLERVMREWGEIFRRVIFPRPSQQRDRFSMA